MILMGQVRFIDRAVSPTGRYHYRNFTAEDNEEMGWDLGKGSKGKMKMGEIGRWRSLPMKYYLGM